MELSLKQQNFELIQKSKKILLVTRQYPTADSIGSILALGLVLEKMNKEVDMVCSGPILSLLSFLPKFNLIQKNIKSAKSFVISLDTSKTKIAQLSYDFDKDGNKLNIYITPEKGVYDSKNISTKTLGFKYDLIIVLDCPDLEILGPIYDQNTELFYETPIINIDHRISNEQYGEINFVDAKASSTAEVLYFFLESLGKNLIDADVATCILTSIIASTKSFQSSNITPKVFSIAAQLVSFGADRQKIIQNIFKNKSLSCLKLWGRALARVKYDHKSKIVWTLVAKDDFLKTNSSAKDLQGIEDELISSVPDAETILILYEDGNQIQGIIKAAKQPNLKVLASCFNSTAKNNLIYLNLKGKTIVEAEKEILAKLKI